MTNRALTMTTTAALVLLLGAVRLFAQGDGLPPELTVEELSDQAYRQGLAEENLIIRRAVEHLENERMADAAVTFRRAAAEMRREGDVAVSSQMVRDLRLAANDLVWLADEIAGGRTPQSEVLLATVAVASHTMARHQREAAQQAFSEGGYKRAGDHLEAAAVHADAALAFGGVSAKPVAPQLEEARQVASRLATGGRGGKLRDRFGSALTGLDSVIARADAEAVWPVRRAIGRVVDHDLDASTVVIETSDGSGPKFRFAEGAVIVGRSGVVPYEALESASEVAVWYRSVTPNIALRIVRAE